MFATIVIISLYNLAVPEIEPQDVAPVSKNCECDYILYFAQALHRAVYDRPNFEFLNRKH